MKNYMTKLKNKDKKTILKSILALLLVVITVSATVLGVYINDLFNKINYTDPVENITYNPQLDIEEEIDFSFDDINEYSVTETDDITEIQYDEATKKKIRQINFKQFIK